MKNQLLFPYLISCLLVGCQMDSPSGTVSPVAPSSQEKTPTKPSISIRETQIINTEKGALLLKGTANNEATSEIKEARASFKLFDREGSEIGQAIAVVNNLAPGFSWTFEVPLDGRSAETAKLDRIVVQPSQ